MQTEHRIWNVVGAKKIEYARNGNAYRNIKLRDNDSGEVIKVTCFGVDQWPHASWAGFYLKTGHVKANRSDFGVSYTLNLKKPFQVASTAEGVDVAIYESDDEYQF
jgi:hypothetical protein